MSRRTPQLPVGHCEVSRVFQCVAVDLVEYKSISRGNRYVLSVIDHLTRFVVLIAVPDKLATTIARQLVTRVISVFGPPETILSDQDREFENAVEGKVPIKIRLRHLAGKTLYLGTHRTSNNAQGIEREIM